MAKHVVFRSQAKRMNRVNWRFRALVAAFTLFIVGGFYFGYTFLSITMELLELQRNPGVARTPVVVAGPSTNPSAPPQTTITQPKPGERVNVLLLGLDQRPEAGGDPSRSDTIMIATLEPRTKTAALLSVPRDLWAAIPRGPGDVVYNKINTGHFFGQYWKYPDGNNPDGGPELAKRTIEYNLGIPIHYYVRVDFRGFEKAVDLIGGLEIDVPKEIYDPAYPTDRVPNETITLHFPPGPQKMDGERALQYARTRNADSDFGRMARQRQVLMAFRDQAVRLDLLPKLPSLLGLMKDSFDTDMPLDQILALGNLARGVKPDNIETHVIDPSMVIPDQPVVGALLPKHDEIQKKISQIFFDPLLREEAAAIEVQNGTLRDGLASATADVLTTWGFQVAHVRQADSSDLNDTQILYFTNKDYTVRKLATLLRVNPSAIQKTERPPGSDVDITVILGKDANPPS